MYRWVRYRRLASPTAMHKRYQPWLYNSCVKKLVIHKWLNGDSRHENIAMLTTPWGNIGIHRHAIQPKCKCDQELFRDLNPILGWISVYTQHWSISPTHSYGNTKDEELCVKKTGDHEHTKRLKKNGLKNRKTTSISWDHAHPQKNGLNIEYLWNHQSAISRLAVTVVISHTSGSVSTIWWIEIVPLPTGWLPPVLLVGLKSHLDIIISIIQDCLLLL